MYYWLIFYCAAGLCGHWNSHVTPPLPNCVLRSYMSPVSTVTRRFTGYWCHSLGPLWLEETESSQSPSTTPHSVLSSKAPSRYRCYFLVVYSSSHFLSVLYSSSVLPMFFINEPQYHFILCLSLSHLVLFLQTWFIMLRGLLGRGAMMYGYCGYSYLLSYGCLISCAAPSQAVIQLLGVISFLATLAAWL